MLNSISPISFTGKYDKSLKKEKITKNLRLPIGAMTGITSSIAPLAMVATPGIIAQSLISSAKEQASTSENQKETQIHPNFQAYINEIKILAAKQDTKIKRVLLDAIENNEKLTIDEISRRAKIKKNRVISAIYSRDNGVKELFEIVKSHHKDDLTAKNMYKADNIVNNAIRFHTTEPELSDAETDYIQYLAKQLRQFKLSKETEIELAEGFKESPIFADELISTKNKSGESRLRQRNLPQILHELFNLYKVNPDLVSELTFKLDKNGDFEFSIKQVLNIVKASMISEKLIEPMMEQPKFVSSLINNADIEGNPRFGADEIVKLAEYNKKVPNFLNLLINYTTTDDKPRFSGEEIAYLIESYFKTPNIVMSLIKTKLNGESTVLILKTLNSDDKAKINLAKELFYRLTEKTYCTSREVIKTLKAYDTKKEISGILSQYKKEIPDEVIDQLHDKYGKTAKEFMDTLGNSGFSAKEIINIMERTKTLFSYEEYNKITKSNPWSRGFNYYDTYFDTYIHYRDCFPRLLRTKEPEEEA